MKKHIKPTPEELEANAQKSLEEAEALKEIPETPETLEDEKPEDKEVEIKEEPVVEDKEVIEDKPQEPDYKKKFVESSREAQILHSKNKKISDAFEKASQLPDPTDDEMKVEYPDWDLMSDFEKKIAKDSVKNTKRFQAMEEVTKGFKKLGDWQDKVNSFIEDPKTLVDNPELDGKEDEFKLFATKPTRIGVPLEDVVSAFLYNVEKEVKMKPKNKGSMFETGTGGANEKQKPKTDKITVDQARILRNTDYKKYTEYLKAGKIEQVE